MTSIEPSDVEGEARHRMAGQFKIAFDQQLSEF